MPLEKQTREPGGKAMCGVHCQAVSWEICFVYMHVWIYFPEMFHQSIYISEVWWSKNILKMNSNSLRETTIEDTLKTYFYDGYNNEVIIQFLSKYHDTHCSIRTLKRRLANLGLSQRKKDAIRQ